MVSKMTANTQPCDFDSINSQIIKSVQELYERVQETYRDLILRDLDKFELVRKVTGIKPFNDVVLVVQGMYGELIPCDMDVFYVLRESTGIDPSGEVVQNSYEKVLQEGYLPNLRKLGSFIKDTGIEMDASLECLVQKRYKSLILPDSDTYQILREATGIEPSEDVVQVVQERYKEMLEYGYLPNLSKLDALIKATGVGIEALLEDDVQKAYNRYVKGYCLYCYKMLKELSGMKPELSEDVVQEGFKICVDERGFELWNLLENDTGLGPSENVIQYVQERYKKYLGGKDNSIGDIVRSLCDLKTTREATKIELSEDAVRLVGRRYEECAENGYLKRIFSLEEATGIEPSERVVQEAYKIWIEHHPPGLEVGVYGRVFIHWAEPLKVLRDREFEPEQSEDIVKAVQEMYKEWVKDGYSPELEALNAVMDITGIKPPEEIVQEKCEG